MFFQISDVFFPPHPTANPAPSLLSADAGCMVDRSEGARHRNGLFHSCACGRVAGVVWLLGSGWATRVCRAAAAARHGGSVFFEVRFRGRGLYGCVLLTEIYKMSSRT